MPPHLTVIAGPNGSGKSSLTDYLIKQGIDFVTYINADEISKRLGLAADEAGSKEAQRLADEQRETCLLKGEDFSFETVMSHESKPNFMAKAKSAGYHVTLFFVATADPNLNVLRVESRVKLGGHDVPHDRIISRYHRSIAPLAQAMISCDRCVVFDNSNLPIKFGAETALRPVLQCHHESKKLEIMALPPVPAWAIDGFNFRKFAIVVPKSRQSRFMRNSLFVHGQKVLKITMIHLLLNKCVMPSRRSAKPSPMGLSFHR